MSDERRGVSFTARQSVPAASLASVDGRRVAYVRAGAGTPAVVLIGGAGMGLASWRGVFGSIAGSTAVLAYDRLGHGGSEKPLVAQSGAVIAATLRSLSREAGIETPFVLVGHSLGGLFANLYARTYPDDVAGVVLVEAAHPEEGTAGARPAGGAVGRLIAGAFGFLDRLRRSTPPSEVTEIPATRAQVAAAGPFPEVPLIVVTGRKPLPPWLLPPAEFAAHQRFQEALLGLAPGSRQVFAFGSGHMPQVTEPGVVADAILAVVSAARARRGGSPPPT